MCSAMNIRWIAFNSLTVSIAVQRGGERNHRVPEPKVGFSSVKLKRYFRRNGQASMAVRKILVVDDDSNLLEYLQRKLKAADYETRTALSANDAVQMIR